MGKALLIIAIIVLLIGLFYVGAPHSYHVASGLDFDMEHSTHQILGVVLIVIAALILWKGRK